MIYFICFLVTLFSCSIGTVCGMGGGIIIKPALDAMGIMSVSAITFLSGITVIFMTCWSLGKTFIKGESVVEVRDTTLLAVGAALGGLLGKQLFNMVASLFIDRNTAGGIQAVFLFFATLATLIYTIKKENIRGKSVNAIALIPFLGGLLGILGAFLGIGGGPFNIAVLYYFFSMPTKKAAQNSLYIVLFSQTAASLKTILSGNVPSFQWLILIGMIVMGVLGSEIGRSINKKLNDRQATIFLEGVMVLILGINLYNISKYLL